MAQHFYDGQIRRYLTQAIRLLSNFSYKDIEGVITPIPVMYGDLSRQVGSVIRDNSENKLPSCPRMAVYVTNLELDRQRLADSTYVSKLNIKERAFNSETNEYDNYNGKGYTIERLMPTPYNLTINVDIWSSNTEQKLQILEQILVLFNPSLELQTNDNFVDWTSLSVIYLESVSWSSRTIGNSTESEIDIATLTFSTPIYISPPVKVKKLGVITSIITSIFNEEQGTIDLDLAVPNLQAYIDNRAKADIKDKISTDDDGNLLSQHTAIIKKADADALVNVTPLDFGLLIRDNTAKLLKNGFQAKASWVEYLKLYPQPFENDITELRLVRSDFNGEIIGTISLVDQSPHEVSINWDVDTIPGDTVLTSDFTASNKIHFIIDPLKTNPTTIKEPGLRLLLIDESIGDVVNTDGADAWKNNDGTDFIASANDIIEWNGTKWSVIFDASESNEQVIYTTNLNTGIQYKYLNGEWLLSYEGEYPQGSWRIVF